LNPRKADRSAEGWRCSIDLHQGDTGTLQFEHVDGNVRGAITVRNGSQRHPISGTWKEDRIEFWRALSERSGQPFAGTVADAGDGVMRIAGRFANEYRGVWSADCRLEGEAGAGAGSSGRLDIVLIDPGENKIAVIKAVRAITGLGLREAKAAVESAPYTIQSGLSEKDAKSVAAELERAGARVAIQPTR